VRRALRSAGLHRAAESVGACDDTNSSSGATVVKTLALVTTRGDLVLCVLPLDRRLRVDRCARAVGVRRADLAMVRTDDLIDVVGFPRGAIGPLGSRRPATVLLDDALLRSERLGQCAGATRAGEQGRLSDSRDGELYFMYRYILRESCSQFDSLPLTCLTI
jgi:prolyl-tRNA editing enzyme YbaK/EbsC (Cys-tRNA(Pro) deacylase)